MASAAGMVVHISTWLLALSHPGLPYQISTVDSLDVCNKTIYLESGAKSAAILRLTSKDYYDFSPLFCVIKFSAPIHIWAGLVGVLEEVDLRRYEDSHRLGQNECVDSIKVIYDGSVPQDSQCGSWSISPSERLSHIGHRKALMGYCPHPQYSSKGVSQCVVSELTVQVSVGQRNNNSLWRDKRWGPHRGFTFVVTAYKFSFGESECHVGSRSCGNGFSSTQNHCVDESLWCDHHINCGQPENMDEISCSHDAEILGGLVTVMVGPWVGTVLLLLLVLGGVMYWRRARPSAPQDPPPAPDINSYAESYEVSSTLSSAHHMAIQVRVVCNPGPGSYSQRTSPWAAADLPPSYDSLFPQGPPPTLPKCTSTTSSTASTPLSSLTANTTSTITAGGGATLATSLDIMAKPIGAHGAASTSAAAAAGTPARVVAREANGFVANATQTSSCGVDNPVHILCNGTGTRAAPREDRCFVTASASCSPCGTPGLEGCRPLRHSLPRSCSSSPRAHPATLPKSRSHAASPCRCAFASSSRCVSPAHLASSSRRPSSPIASTSQTIRQEVIERSEYQGAPRDLPDLASSSSSSSARQREEPSSPGECDDTMTLLRDGSPSTDEEVLSHSPRPLYRSESPPPPAPETPSGGHTPTPNAEEDDPADTTPSASGAPGTFPPMSPVDGARQLSVRSGSSTAPAVEISPSTTSLHDKPMVVRASTMDSETADTLTSTTSWGTLSTDVTEISFADDHSQNTL